MASPPQLAGEHAFPRADNRERLRKAIRPLSIIIVIAVILSSAYIGVVLSRTRGDDNPPKRPVFPDASTLALSGTRVGRDIQISWNPQSPAFSDVKIGVLTIHDGDAKREIALTAAELQAHKLIYTPVTDRVQASLEVFSRARKSQLESVLFVLEPRPDTVARSFENAEIPERPMTTRRAERTVTDTQHRARTEPAAAPPVRGFIPPPPPRQANANRVVVLDAPPLMEVASIGIPSAPAVQLPQVPLTRPQDVKPLERIQQRGATPAKARRAIRQVRAELPLNVVTMLSGRTQVEVRAQVDPTGKVTFAESLASRTGLNQYLGTAAVAAAKLWRFEPSDKTDTVILKFIFEPR